MQVLLERERRERRENVRGKTKGAGEGEGEVHLFHGQYLWLVTSVPFAYPFIPRVIPVAIHIRSFFRIFYEFRMVAVNVNATKNF